MFTVNGINDSVNIGGRYPQALSIPAPSFEIIEDESDDGTEEGTEDPSPYFNF